MGEFSVYRRILLVAAMLAPGLAFGQSYPSPHVNNMTVDGTITGGTITGANASGANVTPSGSTVRTLAAGLAGPFTLVGSGTSGQYDAQIGVTGGGSVAGAGAASQRAASSSFAGVDGTIVFQIPNVAAAVEYVQTVAGISGDGAEVFCTNGLFTGTGVYPNTIANGNVDCVQAAQNQGNHWWVNGNGTLAEIIDPGAPSTYWPQISPGTATTFAKYGSNGNTSLDAPTGSVGYLTVNGIIMASFSNIKALSSSAGYPNFFGSTGSAGIQCTNGSSGVVSCLFQAQSTGAITLSNNSGNFATFVNSGANTAVDGFRFQASSATAPLIITGLGSPPTSVAVGSVSLPANSTQGFFMAPTCVAAPTGTPVGASGYAPMCYNIATHNLNIYDTNAAGWYHVTLTAGAL